MLRKALKKAMVFLGRKDDWSEVISKSFLNFTIRIGSKGLNYILVFMLIRLHGVESFGKWTFSITIFLIFQLISNLGLKAAMIRYFASSNDQNGSINLKDVYLKSLKLLIASGVIFGLILYFSSTKISIEYEKAYLSESLKYLAFGFIALNLVDLNTGVLRGLRKIGKQSFLESTGNPLFSILFIGIGYTFTKDFSSVFGFYLIALYVFCLVSFILVFSEGFKSESHHQKVSSMKILSVSFPMFFTTSTSVLDRWADIMILGFFCSDTQLAGYSLVSRLSKIVSLPLNSVNSISASKFRAKYVENRYLELKMLSKSATKVIVLTSIIPLLILCLFSEYVISVFDRQLVFAISALYFLLAGQFFNVITGSVSQLLNMTDGHVRLMWISLISTTMNLGLNLLLVPLYGINGAAIATLSSLVLNNLMSTYIVYKRLGFAPIYIPFQKVKTN
ncbi:MAG: oligosaccharide flippase family protein [Vicingaceae bacterium]